MLAFCSLKTRELEHENLCGFIFKERSPSCGLTTVPLYNSGVSGLFTAGLFAKEVAGCFPLIPLEEAENLKNPDIRENFIERVFLYSNQHRFGNDLS